MKHTGNTEKIGRRCNSLLLCSVAFLLVHLAIDGLVYLLFLLHAENVITNITVFVIFSIY